MIWSWTPGPQGQVFFVFLFISKTWSSLVQSPFQLQPRALGIYQNFLFPPPNHWEHFPMKVWLFERCSAVFLINSVILLCSCKILVSPSVKNSASRSFHSSPKKSPVHSLLTSSAEDSIGSTSQYRSTKPVHSPDSVKGKSDLITLMRLISYSGELKVVFYNQNNIFHGVLIFKF